MSFRTYNNYTFLTGAQKGESKAFLIFMVLLELRLERNQMHIKVHYMQWKQIV